MVTSLGRSDEWVTLPTGSGVELPLACLLPWLHRRIVLRTMAAFDELTRRTTTRRLCQPQTWFLATGLSGRARRSEPARAAGRLTPPAGEDRVAAGGGESTRVGRARAS